MKINSFLLNIGLGFIIILVLLYLFVPNEAKLFNKDILSNKKNIISANSNSKGLIDIYSFSHIDHGILFYYILNYFKISPLNIISISVICELVWEIFENTDYIINKYRSNSEYKNYNGDSIINIIGDILSMLVGLYISFNCNYAWIYLIISELILSFYNADIIKLTIGSLLKK